MYGRTLTAVVRAVLVFLSLYHLVTGVVSMCFPGFSEVFYQALYHFHPNMTEQYQMILKPWGALAFFAGVVGLFAAADPVRYRGVILALVILLATRATYRVLFAPEMQDLFRVDLARNMINSGIIACEVLLFSLWLWHTRGEGPGEPGGTPRLAGTP